MPATFDTTVSSIVVLPAVPEPFWTAERDAAEAVAGVVEVVVVSAIGVSLRGPAGTRSQRLLFTDETG